MPALLPSEESIVLPEITPEELADAEEALLELMEKQRDTGSFTTRFRGGEVRATTGAATQLLVLLLIAALFVTWIDIDDDTDKPTRRKRRRRHKQCVEKLFDAIQRAEFHLGTDLSPWERAFHTDNNAKRYRRIFNSRA